MKIPKFSVDVYLNILCELHDLQASSMFESVKVYHLIVTPLQMVVVAEVGRKLALLYLSTLVIDRRV